MIVYREREFVHQVGSIVLIRVTFQPMERCAKNSCQASENLLTVVGVLFGEEVNFFQERDREMPIKITIDEEACIACGACEAICPDIFYMDGDKAKVKNDANFKDLKAEIEDARTGCPVECIAVE